MMYRVEFTFTVDSEEDGGVIRVAASSEVEAIAKVEAWAAGRYGGDFIGVDRVEEVKQQ